MAARSLSTDAPSYSACSLPLQPQQGSVSGLHGPRRSHVQAVRAILVGATLVLALAWGVSGGQRTLLSLAPTPLAPSVPRPMVFPQARPAAPGPVVGSWPAPALPRGVLRALPSTEARTPGPATGATEERAAALLRSLRERYPEEPLHYFTKPFLASVAELVARHNNPIEYYVRKLSEITEWRKVERVNGILQEEFPRLEPGVMFWHGVDKLRQPVLFVRPGLVDMAEFDEEKTYRTVVAVIEEGIARMDDVVRFSVVIDSTGVGVRYFMPNFIKRLFYLMALPYRYRLGTVLVGPTNPMVTAIWQIAAPIIPPTFRKNVILSSNPLQALRTLMDEDQIPAGLFAK